MYLENITAKCNILLEQDDVTGVIQVLEKVPKAGVPVVLEQLGFTAAHNAKTRKELINRFAKVAWWYTSVGKREAARIERQQALNHEIRRLNQCLSDNERMMRDFGASEQASLPVGMTRLDVMKRISELESQLRKDSP